VPREQGQGNTAAGTARLPRFFDQACDPVRVRTAYRCRAYPDQAQQQVLARTFGCIRVVWNQTLANRRARYAASGTGSSYAQTDRALTAMKKDPELAFLAEVSSVPLQQALRHQHQAFAAFFAKRARYPRFKSRRGRQSAHYTRSAFTLRGGALRLAKTGAPLRFTWSWPDIDLGTLDPAMVIIAREPDGRWYVTFTLDTAAPEPFPEVGRAVGVDLGVKDFAVTSDGERIANPRHLERKAANLARYQRRLARRRTGSANRARAAAKVARAHRKVRNARADFLHRASTRLVRGNDLIAIEDLAVANMIRNRHLARAISDCGWGEFRRQLEYKCQRYGRRLVVIGRWYPSSKTCAACGHLLAELSLPTRHWTCPSCRARHDRDVNAAQNILAAGLAVARGSPGDACGAVSDIRGPPGCGRR
jgi:putative transposase